MVPDARVARELGEIAAEVSRGSEHGDAAGVAAEVLQAKAHDRPRRLKRKALGPFENGDARMLKNVLETERFEIVEGIDAVQIGVMDFVGFAVNVNQREGGTRNVLFGGRAEPGNDPFRKRGLARPEVAGECDQNGSAKRLREFTAPGDGLFRGVR